MSLTTLARFIGTCLLVLALPASIAAQTLHGTVVDQTGLPLPGAAIQLLDGSAVIASIVSDASGTFVIDGALPGDTVSVSLDGFETTRVARREAARIELRLGRATESTTVVASPVDAASPTAALIGTELTATTVARMPSAHMKASESLPLLPSVIRGPDGLMQLGGARAFNTPLTLDGFNITDPATGISSVNLPLETVRAIDVLRDPMSVTYGGLLGGLVRVESRPGSDTFSGGVQGFIPRPRFTSPGIGRIEGIFPRAYVSGSTAAGRLRYVASAEYDYERIPVPEVTGKTGSDLIEESAILFARIDAQLTDRNSVTFETFAFPSGTRALGLGPRRDLSATIDASATDLFAGVTHRFLSTSVGLFTTQIGVLSREADVTPRGTGQSFLSPAGWTGNWFASVNRSGVRYTVAVAWERVLLVRGRSHDVTMSGEVAARRLAGRVDERAISVSDSGGRLVRSVDFGPPASVGASDRPVSVAVRDVWQVGQRTQIDVGGRVDRSRHGGSAPSGRIGLRHALDRDGVTVLKVGYGKFVGALPLSVPAFAGYPVRLDRSYAADSGDLLSEIAYRPAVGRLRLPRGLATVVAVERRLAEGLDAQVSLTNRTSSRLATLHVPLGGGDLSVQSSGYATYREVQLSMRRTWANDQQLFVSYVRSSTRGELNDFTGLFQTMDAPLLQPGGMSRTQGDARNRVLAWGTFNLPRRVVVSPVTEWRSGFPFSELNTRHFYDGSPHSRSFPRFMAVDAVVYKTLTVMRRTADVGIQLFNLTRHYNPRDVYAVVSAPRGGQFTNSVGTIMRGYLLLKW